jgi:hypothetical protein
VCRVCYSYLIDVIEGSVAFTLARAKQATSVCMSLCVCVVCVYVCTCVCASVCVRVCVCASMCVLRMRVHLRGYFCVFLDACMSLRVCECVRMQYRVCRVKDSIEPEAQRARR